MRWIEILATTNSGKAQFICKYCGRMSISWEEHCPSPPFLATGGAGQHPLWGVTCYELEKRERSSITQSITWNAIPRSDALLDTLERALTRDAKRAVVRKDRRLIFGYLYAMFSQHLGSAITAHERQQRRRLDDLHQLGLEEIGNK